MTFIARQHPARLTWLLKSVFGLLAALPLLACNREPPTVAVIPRTCGTPLWEPEHAGAATVARSTGFDLYWNAPTQNDDVQGQIALMEKAEARGDRALILSPIETFLQAPVRRLLARGTPVVVIDTDLGIKPAAGGGLTYVMSDEEAGGQMAARRLGAILHGKGSVAVLGIDPRLSRF